MTRQSRRDSRHSPNLPENLLWTVELFVPVLERREPHRLLATQRKHTEHRETVIEQPVHFLLERLVEIDQHVPAQDHVEFRKRVIGYEIVQREHDVLRERRIEKRATVSRE